MLSFKLFILRARSLLGGAPANFRASSSESRIFGGVHVPLANSQTLLVISVSSHGQVQRFMEIKCWDVKVAPLPVITQAHHIQIRVESYITLVVALLHLVGLNDETNFFAEQTF